MQEKISHDVAKEKAEQEYLKYKDKMKTELTNVEKHFIESIDEIEKVI